ncbi:FAD-dependent oxidoreductase [Mycolicibacterium pulveris]|uniref:Pyridine nucleotide-disulfide oxidoreductase n=1 Tax=Mycolicibacterium pulveris TaxID=36813 RepID=A0A7I7UQ47_MYCPV|nr:FAD-dependent oxidoreductase [Mycolicibacterium pulveris]MCV6983694.1 FAD-dependent oxidoreductase [Mycolicibacterium pulveris]BBY83575.1 pyridine nucleotide-disulfide oxidoreductase [Mycolicibacterium pulveris]
MTTSSTMVIVGGGLAAAKAAEALRDKDFDGHIVLFTAEDHLPYERPPLSKEFLAGKKTLSDFTVASAAWYRDHHVELQLGTEVTGIDPGAHTVALPDGESVRYDKLVLATGSRPRTLPIPGAHSSGVHYLRTIDDAETLKSTLKEGVSLAIVGAGWIGLEVAANARELGASVTVVETAEMPLQAAPGRELGEVFANLHREHDVDLRLSTTVEEITTADGAATGLKLSDGSTVGADRVLIAVGATPNTALAEAAGLAIADGGVQVDSSLRTSDPDIYAVGDIAAAEHPLLGTRIRVEHWANALKQPAVAADAILGRPAEYADLPYFFTDQYDLGMEYVGYAPDYARVAYRGDVAAREFTAFWFDGDSRVVAGMNVNIWEGLDDIKALISVREPIDPERIGAQ